MPRRRRSREVVPAPPGQLDKVLHSCLRQPGYAGGLMAVFVAMERDQHNWRKTKCLDEARGALTTETAQMKLCGPNTRINPTPTDGGCY